MLTVAKKNLKSKLMVAFMIFMVLFEFVGQSTGIGVKAYAVSNIFDVVSDDGTIGNGGGITTGSTDSITTIITQYKSIAVAITGILTITMLIFMLIQFTKLGAAGDNEMARKKAIMGILTTGIATMLLGGATIVVGFFWNVLNSTGQQAAAPPASP